MNRLTTVVAMSNVSFLIYVLMMFFFFTVPSASSKGDHRVPSKHVALFVFGDSVFDPGNNNFRNISNDSKANFWPYGETFFKFPTGRYTDGRILPDFLSMYLRIPLWKPYLAPGKHNLLHGANFASGGAAVLPEYSVEGPVSFSEQLSYFEDVAGLLKKQIGDEEAKEMLKRAVYLSSLGGIDILFSDVYINGTQVQRQELINMVIGNITQGIKKIYAIGGRKFAFQNVGPIGCMPVGSKKG
ncbi:GDSL esterase/lipase 5 isoform X2 [Hevea brasiliensis]|uniref:GDSL esterase/lipase 5 isoform X2 n=1 Tax=Hevea brasiliensis TaxID=3981 RepID=UPI0025F15ECA|nr:GDSL esterase/lipase 5 isoform X2 [Hevea brasiliensis]